MPFAERDLEEIARPREMAEPLALRAQALDDYLRQIEALLGSGRTEAALELLGRMRRILSYATRKPSA